MWDRTFLDRALSTFRLRIAYGETGGQPPSAYSVFNNFIVGSRGGLPSLTPSSINGNPELKPERQREIEGGFDAGFLNNRASLEFTLYDKQSRDLVLSVPLSLSSGYSTQLQNIGALSNKGVKIGLDAQIIETGAVRWNSRVGYSANRSRIALGS